MERMALNGGGKERVSLNPARITQRFSLSDNGDGRLDLAIETITTARNSRVGLPAEIVKDLAPLLHHKEVCHVCGKKIMGEPVNIGRCSETAVEKWGVGPVGEFLFRHDHCAPGSRNWLNKFWNRLSPEWQAFYSRNSNLATALAGTEMEEEDEA